MAEIVLEQSLMRVKVPVTNPAIVRHLSGVNAGMNVPTVLIKESLCAEVTLVTSYIRVLVLAQQFSFPIFERLLTNVAFVTLFGVYPSEVIMHCDFISVRFPASVAHNGSSVRQSGAILLVHF